MVWAVSTLPSPLRPAAAGEEGWLGEAQSASTPCPFLARGTTRRRAPVCLICLARRLGSSYLNRPPSDLICVFWGWYLV